MLGVFLVMAQFAQAGTVNFSGRDWTTNDAVHRDDAGISNSYVVNNADSMTMTGVFGTGAGVDTYVTTPISLSIGDVVSYDYYLTQETRDPVGDGDSSWISDSTTGPKDVSDVWIAYTYFDNGYTWLWTTVNGWDDVSLIDATAPGTGIHFEWVFDGATQYTLTATAIGNSAQIGSWTDSASMTDITLITQWYHGIWDSEQDVTIENFTHTQDTTSPIPTYPVNTENEPNSLTLEWMAPTDHTPLGYNIYIDPNEADVSARKASVKYNTVLDTDVNHAVELAFDTQYYWLVEAVSDNAPPDPNFIPSAVVSFTTTPPDSAIETQPVGATVDAGQPVDTLVVSGRNVTTHQWHLDDAAIVGATSATYPIAAIAPGDEGVYHCVVSNGDVADEQETDHVVVLIKNDLASPELYYSFDADDFSDDSGNGWDGTLKLVDPNTLDPAPDPVADHSFTSDAISGRAVTFGGETSYVDIVGSEDGLNFYPQGYTTSCWIKNDETKNSYEIAVAKVGVDAEDAGAGWGTGVVNFYSDPNGAFASLRASGDRYSGPWTSLELVGRVNGYQLVVATYDPITALHKLHWVYDNQSLVYIEGAVGTPKLETGPLLLGTENVVDVMDGEVQIGDALWAQFSGSLDEVKIWNYALSDDDIAGLFAAESGNWVCTEDVLYDFDGDCKVGLSDFALFALEYLNDNRVY